MKQSSLHEIAAKWLDDHSADGSKSNMGFRETVDSFVRLMRRLAKQRKLDSK